MTRRAATITLCALLSTTAACGGGGGGGDDGGGPTNVPPPPPPPPAVTAGTFKDANVGGLGFASGAESGVTGADGGFTCESGAAVSFSIGAVELGSTDCATVVTPASLTASGELGDPETVNRVRFLLMLDVDGDPDNGITISQAVQEVAAGWAQPDFAAAELDAELADIISDAFSVDQTAHDLPDAATALDHLLGTVECVFAGAFAGTLSGDLTGAITVRIGFPVTPNTPFNAGVLDWRGVGGDEFFVGGGGSNSVVYAALPVIDHDGTNLAGPMTAQFETPDRITGTWASPANSLSGTFSADRLGDDAGEYRFIGLYGSSETEGSIALSLTGTTVTGEAFDLVDGTFFDVSGSLSGDVMELTATGGGETVNATADLARDAEGRPQTINGSWSGGSFRAAACRLN